MNVKQLIEELSKYPPHAMVIRSGCEGGKEEVKSTEQCRIELNVNDEWYYGSHEVRADGDTQLFIFFNILI